MPYFSFSLFIHAFLSFLSYPIHTSKACINALGWALQFKGGNVAEETRSKQVKQGRAGKLEGMPEQGGSKRSGMKD